MAYRSGLFNSVNGDRKYQALHFAEYFATFIGNGVFPNPSNGLQVYAKENMTVTVKAGKAWINGYYFVNDSDCDLRIENADGVLKRKDRIVLQFDASTRLITPVVKKGTFSATPVVPVLQRDAGVYELALATISIDKGTVTITQSLIVDERLDTSVCGIVHGTVDQVDTTTLFNQYQSWLNEQKEFYENDVENWKEEKKFQLDAWINNETNDFNEFKNRILSDFELWQTQEKREFDTWFDEIAGVLDENAATNIMNIINDIRVDMKSAFTKSLTTNISDAQKVLDEGMDFGNLIATFALSKAGNYTDMALAPFEYESITTSAIKIRPFYVGSSPIRITSKEKVDLSNIKNIRATLSLLNPEPSGYAAPTKYLRKLCVLNDSKEIIREVSFLDKSMIDNFVLDVSDLTGLCYFSLEVYANGGTGSNGLFYANITDISFDYINEPALKFLREGNKVTLNTNAVTGSFHTDYFEVTPTFITSWFSISALNRTPEGSYIRYDLYDEENNLLKFDLKVGDNLKDVTAPRVKLKVTLMRENVEVGAPEFSWVALSYLSTDAVVGWNEIASIELTETSYNIEFYTQNKYNEIKIIGENVYGSSTASLNLVVNGETTYPLNFTSSGSTPIGTASAPGNFVVEFINADSTSKKLARLTKVATGQTGQTTTEAFSAQINATGNDRIERIVITNTLLAGKFKVLGR